MLGRLLSGAAILTAALAVSTAHAKAPQVQPDQSSPRSWPRLVGARTPECLQAYSLARASFRSTTADLNEALRAAPGLDRALSLDPKKTDRADSLVVDPAAFSKVDSLGEGRLVYWGLLTPGGERLSVLSELIGWRGDMYATYLLPVDAKADVLAHQVDGGPLRAGQVLAQQRWTPPLVLWARSKRAVWLIQPGEPYEHVPDWRVFAPVPNVVREVCTIEFGPHKATPLALLPAPVRRFAAALDEALGPGNDEGTLQPTAQIRVLTVGQVLANAALRPWALTQSPYNTHAQVEAGLEGWATHVPRRRAVARQILALYGPAEHALFAYYRREFGASASTAEQMASYATDVLFRSYFVFSGGGASNPTGAHNPWPAEVR